MDNINNELKLYFVTWNVATKHPEQDLHQLLKLKSSETCKNLDDIYVIGLQEVKSQPQNIIIDTFFEDAWTKSFREILKIYDYVNVRTQRLQGLILNIFCLRKHIKYLRAVDSQYTKIGFNGLWGNKGAVSIRFEIYGINLCIINAHLTPHDHLLTNRISDYNSIIKEHLYFLPYKVDIFSHDYVFWIGDLNFRLMDRLNWNDINSLLKKNDLNTLLTEDQLKISMRNCTAFTELTEDMITFPPTYKYEYTSQKFDMKRRPSWTDRILYKVKQDESLRATQLNYTCHSPYVQSDHKPVSGEFIIKTQPSAIKDEVEIEPIDTWYVNEENAVLLKFTNCQEIKSYDWIGLYNEKFCTFSEYLVYEYVSKGKFARLEEQSENTKKMFFNASSITSVGIHRLVYISQNVQKIEVLGMSLPFRICIR